MKKSNKREIKEHLFKDIKMFKKEANEDRELLKNLGEKKMKKQSRKDREDESLGEREGKESSKKQSYKSRRHESKGASKHHKSAMEHLKKAHEALVKLHEAEAGRKYNRSEKHKKAESRGMKRAMRGR